MKTIIPIILILLCQLSTAMAQENNPKIKPLKIGDQVPEVILTNVMNHPTGTVKLSDYRGKWLILDFWATWCSPCIAMFPRTDSLQEAFKGQVQFLSITYEEENEVTTLFNKLEKLHGLKPLMVTRDSSLALMFPHNELPHYVWINPEGKVAAITGYEDVTANKLSSAMTSEKPEIAAKKDTPNTFTRYDHLVQIYPGAREQFMYCSVLTGFIEDVHNFQYTPDNKHILVMNLPLLSLYALAYGERKMYFGQNLIRLETRDPSKFNPDLTGDAYQSWLKNGGSYCYEVVVSESQNVSAHMIMQADMTRHFPQYIASVEKRKISVLALVRTSGKDKIGSAGGKRSQDIKRYGIALHNSPLSTLTRMLQIKFLQHLPTPVVDQTGYTDPVDIIVEADLSDVAAIRKALLAYDMDIVEKETEMAVLVIRDAGPTLGGEVN